ncbi:hypothetical protein, partial [Streptomyces acidicola]|uniref:hypothetical protein n=1 Tax=Streptomyces acidicola TaxID=2596892 RepID=UPI001883A129
PTPTPTDPARNNNETQQPHTTTPNSHNSPATNQPPAASAGDHELTADRIRAALWEGTDARALLERIADREGEQNRVRN